MKSFFFIFFGVVLVLAGCSQNNHSNHENDDIPKMLEVALELPEEIRINEEIQIEAIVFQGNEAVEDANEVLFEVVKSNDEEGEKIQATHNGNGVYSITTLFIEEGDYYVIAHVTARDMHIMPKKLIKVIIE